MKCLSVACQDRPRFGTHIPVTATEGSERLRLPACTQWIVSSRGVPFKRSSTYAHVDRHDAVSTIAADDFQGRLAVGEIVVYPPVGTVSLQDFTFGTRRSFGAVEGTQMVIILIFRSQR